MKEIIFASNNKGKIGEAKKILRPIEIVTMSDIGYNEEIIEDGNTFEQNAAKKALAVLKKAQRPVIADDSGLEIDYLGGDPGVYSSRFLGEDTPYDYKNAQIIEKLIGVPFEKRTARFKCVVALALPSGRIFYERGILEGYIVDKPKGNNGFGYDPIFYVLEYEMTTAEMPINFKNKISHRAQALLKIKEALLSSENISY